MKAARISMFAIAALALWVGTPSPSRADRSFESVTEDAPRLKAAFAIHNTTGFPIHYRIKWGTGDWERITIEPGGSHVHPHLLNDKDLAPRPYIVFNYIVGEHSPKEYHLQFNDVGYAGYGPDGYYTTPKPYDFVTDGRFLDLQER